MLFYPCHWYIVVSFINGWPGLTQLLISYHFLIPTMTYNVQVQYRTKVTIK